MTARRLIILVAALALAAGMFVSSVYRQPDLPASQTPSNSDMVGSLRPDFSLGSSTGAIVSPADFSGNTLLINFWATWCMPCRDEMPMLMELQAEYRAAGLQIIGIALDDVQSVREFVQSLGISYPILVGEADVMGTNYAYGNVTGMLPYSVLVDRDGVIRWQHLGEIKREEFSSVLEGLL